MFQLQSVILSRHTFKHKTVMLQRLCGTNYYTCQLRSSSTLCLGLPSSFFPSRFLTKIPYTLLISSICSATSNHFVLLDMITLTISDKHCKLSSSSYFLFLGLTGFIITLVSCTPNVRVCSVLTARH
jgi:hypothetical protein